MHLNIISWLAPNWLHYHIYPPVEIGQFKDDLFTSSVGSVGPIEMHIIKDIPATIQTKGFTYQPMI